MPTQEVKVVFTSEGEVLTQETGDRFVIQAQIASVPASWASQFGDVALDVGQKYDQIESWHDELSNWDASIDASVNAGIASITLEGAQALNDIQSERDTGVAAVGAQRDAAVATVQVEGSARLTAIEDAGTTGLASVQSAATLGVANVQSAEASGVSTVTSTADARVTEITGLIADFGGVNYRDDWDAASNTPTLVSSTGTKGDLYRVVTAGNTTLDGFSNWQVGDWAIFDGSGWQRVAESVGGGIEFQGDWNAQTNAPTLASGVGTKGHFYRVTRAGTTPLDGYSAWQVGDWVMFDGQQWRGIPPSVSFSLMDIKPLLVTPDTPSNGEMQAYQKGSKYVLRYNDNGVVRYKWLDMAGTGVDWVHSTVAP